MKAAASPSAVAAPLPQPLRGPGLAAGRPWGAWASFKRAETTNGPRLCLTSPVGAFEGKQNAAGLLIPRRGVGERHPGARGWGSDPGQAPALATPTHLLKEPDSPHLPNGSKIHRADVETGWRVELTQLEHSSNQDGCTVTVAAASGGAGHADDQWGINVEELYSRRPTSRLKPQPCALPNLRASVSSSRK